MDADTARALARTEARFLGDYPTLVALNAGLATGLLDRLCRDGLARDGAHAELLLHLLERGGAIVPRQDRWVAGEDLARLHAIRWEGFAARLRFTAMAAADLLTGGAACFGDLPAFMAQSRTFGFFNYARALGTGAANLQDTEPWCAYVTALSELEAPVLAPLLPLEGVARLLEIGGNTGAFALGVLARWPGLHVTVLDLPAVAGLGRRHVAARGQGGRIDFVAGDMRADPLPHVAGQPPRAILFKSVLHDWPEDQARGMIARAAAHLPPGGRLIVCERGAFADEADAGGLAGAANLVFARFYRRPGFYEDAFRAAGLTLLPGRDAMLDMLFHVIAGQKP
ncbi:methyltransferase type 12 [Halovulum dunhuangense]|uniref:Methyltransferase type 12 n=1 Tax=Halovulum dunhuangense TaxID=1505036 RepID=A0A849L2C5_9RHOB|nr:methyltransferase [Halovulum dunhuangense]NNU80361.1 methyltransferase type 12 [Halovulum dunhuangense]